MQWSEGAYCPRCKLRVGDLRTRSVADLLIKTDHQIGFGGDMSILRCGRDADDKMAAAVRAVQLAKSAANDPPWL